MKVHFKVELKRAVIKHAFAIHARGCTAKKELPSCPACKERDAVFARIGKELGMDTDSVLRMLGK